MEVEIVMVEEIEEVFLTTCAFSRQKKRNRHDASRF